MALIGCFLLLVAAAAAVADFFPEDAAFDFEYAADAAAAAEKGTWREEDAARRFLVDKPEPIEYTPENKEKFFYDLLAKLEDMPMPYNSSYIFLKDRAGQAVACELPEDDGDEYGVSGNPSFIMQHIAKSFPRGKCARRAIGPWYYQVCGNLEIIRSPFTLTTGRGGRPAIMASHAYESLGMMARDRRISTHLNSILEPRYIAQTYYGGQRCRVEGQERRIKSTVRFECSYRFVAGYVHIDEVIEENPCEYRLTLQSLDFCENDWLAGRLASTEVIYCRLYFHPNRVHPLVMFLNKYHQEKKGMMKRYDEFMSSPEQRLLMEMRAEVEPSRRTLEKWARDSLEDFREQDDPYSRESHEEREMRTMDYVMSEMTWIGLNPSSPFTEEETRMREEEEREGREVDRRMLIKLRSHLEATRARQRVEMEALSEEDRPLFGLEILEEKTYRELMEQSDMDEMEGGPYLYFYAFWLDYIWFLEEKEEREERLTLIPPFRKFPLGAYMLLEGLVKSPYTEVIKGLFQEVFEVEEAVKVEPIFGEELDQNDLVEMAENFMKVFKAMKDGKPVDEIVKLADDFEY